MNSRKPFFDRFADQVDPIDETDNGAKERSIGELISEARKLSPAQVEQIVAHQRKKGIRFGEAAIALKLATTDDVLRALSRQFAYDYSPAGPNDGASQELVIATHPFSTEAEAFRELRSQLMMGVLANAESRRALAVVSPDIRDGKTYIASNLAVAFSQLGDRTLLLDADMRTPRQHSVFGLKSDLSGLSAVLSGRSEGMAVHRVEHLPNLYVMPVGAVPPNPLELLQHPGFGLLLLELLAKFDHVVIDTPAAVHGADARVIAAQAGASLVVGRKGSSRVDAVQGLLKQLGKGPGVVAGVVLNEH